MVDFRSIYSRYTLEFNNEKQQSGKLGLDRMSGQKYINYIYIFLMEMLVSEVVEDKVWVSLYIYF